MAQKSNKHRRLPLLQPILVLGVLSWLLSVYPAMLQSQSEKPQTVETVRVTDTRGSFSVKNASYVVTVVGMVENSLKVPVASVNVEIILKSTTNKGKATISAINANSMATFIVEVASKRKPTTFVSQVVSYRLHSDNVKQIMHYFWNYGKDPYLRDAAVAGLQHIPTKGYTGLVAYFRQLAPGGFAFSPNQDLVEILLLLPTMGQTGRVDAAQAVLDKAAILDNRRFQTTYQILLSLAKKSNTVVPLLNKIAKKDKSLNQLLNDTLVEIGNAALPGLLLATPNRKQEYLLAQQVLHRMGFDSLQKKVDALVSAAVKGGPMQYSSIEYALSLLPPEADEILIRLFTDSSPAHRSFIARQLRQRWSTFQPTVQSILRQQGMQLSGTLSQEEGLNLLHTLYLYKRMNSISQLYRQGVENYQKNKTSKKDDSLLRLEQMEKQMIYTLSGKKSFDIKKAGQEKALIDTYWPPNSRHQAALAPNLAQLRLTLQSETSTNLERSVNLYTLLFIRERLAQLYRLNLEKAQQQNNWEQADTYFQLLETYQWDINLTPPQQAQLYKTQAQTARQAGQYGIAINYLRQAGQLMGNPALAGKEMGEIMIRKHPVLLILLLIMVIITALIVFRIQTEQLSSHFPGQEKIQQ